ncbi:MAG: hydroxymethylbilane synthase [Gemmatimonadetes bacterium]|nr:hydroxymethylbilane synthase [Gemmatimonadota bacterium]NNM04225.1 hydroxymethylbilane synthase [Gemmatimonadota bacterium]
MTGPRERIRIGTRGSALARWQAEHVASALRALPAGPDADLVLIQTEGDKIQDVPLSGVQGKAFFTKEIEEALLGGDVDVAVHSLKDLATVLPEGLELGAIMEREDARDVLLCSSSVAPTGSLSSLNDLPEGARVGTSSLRRRALLARGRPDLDIGDLRGNVPTRVRKLDEGQYDAVVLAAAGVKRLGLEHRISFYLPLDEFLPAVSQGAVAVQTRSGDAPVSRWVGALDHSKTRATTTAERAFLRTLEGGCQIPVGAIGRVEERGLRLRGTICSLDGTRAVYGEVTGRLEDAEFLGQSLAQDLEARGGRSILDEIKGVGS